MTTEEAVAVESPVATEVPSPLEEKIIRQIEYYFGDVNLPRDKFLNEKITEDDAWVTLECLTTFARLKQLSSDLEEIKNALKKSTSGLLEIHETEYKIRRSPDRPLPDIDDPIIKKSAKEKTLYMKGFPAEYTFDNVQEFFDTQNVKTVFIKMRKDNDKQFKGSIFVEVSTIDEVKSLVENKELKCVNPLSVQLRDDYFKTKTDQRKEADRVRKEVFDEKPKIEEKSGCILHFKAVGENTKRENIKELFGAHAQIAWVDFNIGETEGFIRFQEENTAQKALDAVKAANDEGKVLINGTESTLRVLEGEEETNYWKTLQEDLQKRARGGAGRNRGSRGGGRGGGRGRGRGGRGGGRERYQGKRSRPWEDRKKDDASAEDSVSKPENDHIKFDDKAEKLSDSSEAKKAKVENEV